METEALNIDNEISNAVNAAEEKASVEVENVKEPVSDEQEETDLETEGGETEGIDKELKTVRKALEKRNRYINNQRQRIRALEDQMQKMQQSFEQNKPKSAPSMEQFDSAIDYIKADQAHALDKRFTEQQQEQQLAMLRQQQDAVRQQQIAEVAQNMNELLNSNHDMKKVISDNAAVIGSMPQHIEKLMYEIDDAPAATYALAKEGRLQDLYNMPEHIAAAHLVQAEIRGQQYLQQAAKPIKEAPKPIGSLKGAGKTSTKSLGQMNPDELGKWLNS